MSQVVIDTTVLRSAGAEVRDHPVSLNCRLFLDHVLKGTSVVLISSKSMEEFKKHKSRYALLWMAKMDGRRRVKRIDLTTDVHIVKWRGPVSEKNEMEILKDWHLLQMAWAGNKIVFSSDKKLPALVKKYVSCSVDLKIITWVCPVEHLVAAQQIADRNPIDSSRFRLFS